MWKKLSPDDKQIWKKLAADVKAKHAEEHPGYRYKPRRRETPRRRIRFEGDLKKSRDEYSEHTLDFSSPCSSAECSPVRGKGRRVSLVPDDISFDALPPSPTKGHHDIKGRELSLFMPNWVSSYLPIVTLVVAELQISSPIPFKTLLRPPFHRPSILLRSCQAPMLMAKKAQMPIASFSTLHSNLHIIRQYVTDLHSFFALS